MILVYLIELGLLVLLSAFLIYYYAARDAALYAKLLVFLSFLVTILCFVILPIDIAESSKDDSEAVDTVKHAWLIIYFINFFLCWFVLPFAQ